MSEKNELEKQLENQGKNAGKKIGKKTAKAAGKTAKNVTQFVLKKVFYALCTLAPGGLAIAAFLILGVCYVLIAKEGAASQGIGTYTVFSAEVEAYRNDVVAICEEQGIIEYVNHILAIMQVETGGTTTDPMNAGDKEFNTIYSKRRGYIEDPLYSIEVGIKEFVALLDLADVNTMYDTDKLMLVYQAYHFDRAYIAAAKETGYSVTGAKEYLKSNGSLPYYLRPSFAANVATYVSIQSGNLENFCYPVDEPLDILTNFGEDTANGVISTGTYFKTDGSSPVYAITDGLITPEVTNSNSITIEHGNYIIRYRLLSVYEDYIPEDLADEEDEDEEEDWEEIYVDKREEIGQTKRQDDSYVVFLSVMYDGYYVNPMTILNLTIENTYEGNEAYDSQRDAIVDYAKLWLSTPYVWGGTSLTDGVDCSGFMQQIYKNFGYSIPRTSREQAKYSGAVWTTTEVVPDVLLKGDLLFYVDTSGVVNHVTMYIGDGLIIGAQSSKTGIKITQYNYRTPVKAIRVIP